MNVCCLNIRPKHIDQCLKLSNQFVDTVIKIIVVIAATFPFICYSDGLCADYTKVLSVAGYKNEDNVSIYKSSFNTLFVDLSFYIIASNEDLPIIRKIVLRLKNNTDNPISAISYAPQVGFIKYTNPERRTAIDFACYLPVEVMELGDKSAEEFFVLPRKEKDFAFSYKESCQMNQYGDVTLNTIFYKMLKQQINNDPTVKSGLFFGSGTGVNLNVNKYIRVYPLKTKRKAK